MKKAKSKNLSSFYNEAGDYTIIENENTEQERILGFCSTKKEAEEEIKKLIKQIDINNSEL